MSRPLTIAVLAALLLLPATAFATTYESSTWIDGYEAAADSCIVEFTDDADFPTVSIALTEAGHPLRQVSLPEGIPIAVADFAELQNWRGGDLFAGLAQTDPAVDLQAQMNRLAEVPGIKAVWPNYIHRASFKPNDPYYAGYQGNLRQIYLEKAWDLTRGSGATVAVIDTGFRKSGMEDAPVNILTGYDFWGNDSDVRDYIGHGTHVSNTVAENTNNGIGCAGVANQATILPLKVFPDYDDGALEYDIIDAINYAASHGADVINMSLGGGGYVGTTNTAINNAYNNDIVVVAASGNSGMGAVEYPAAYTNCVAVGAVRQHAVGANPVRASFSCYGSALDLVAPGVSITQETFYNNNVDYYSYDGTSSASPHVAGVAALLVAYGGADAPAIVQAMKNTAHNPNGGFTNQLGYGEVDAYAALVAYGGVSANEPPVAKATASPESGSAPLTVVFNGGSSYDPDGSIESYKWKIAETSEIISNNKSFSYIFDEAGTYHVQLTVTDDRDATGLDTLVITVKDSGSDDDDDSDFGDDPCATLIEAVYYECDFVFHYSNDQIVDAQYAYSMCLEDQTQDGWECLLDCFDKADGCDYWRECAEKKCGLSVYEDTGGDDDDDSSGFSCG